LLEFRNAAGPGHVGHDVVGEPAFEDRHEVPFGVAPLAPGDGGTDLFADLPQRVDTFGRTWLLEPVDVTGLFQGPAQPDGGRHIETTVGVDQHLHIRPYRLADQCGEFGCLALVLAGHAAVEIAIALFPAVSLIGKGIELEGGVTGVYDSPDLSNHCLRTGEPALVGMSVEQD